MSTLLGRVLELLANWRRPLVVGLHVGLICVSNCLAFLLRFDGTIPFPKALLVTQMLPWLVIVRGLVFVPFRLYQGMWRYSGIWDLRNIIAGVCLSSVVFYVLVHFGLGETAYPRAVFFIDGMLLIGFMGGLRLSRRLYREVGRRQGRRRVLIYGAGDAGEMIAREMRQNVNYACEPVGFIDDDLRKGSRRMASWLQVLGSRATLPAVIQKHRP